MSESDTLTAEIAKGQPKKGEYGKGSLVQRGKRWQISYYDNHGRRRRESYSTQRKAQKALEQKLILKETGKLDEPDGRTTVDVLAELYLADRKRSPPKSCLWLVTQNPKTVPNETGVMLGS